MGKPEGPWWNLVSSHVLIQGQWNVKWTIWTNWCGFPGVFIPGVFGEVGTLFSSPEAVQRAGLGSGSGVWGSNNWTLVCRVARSSARLHLKTCAKHLKLTQKIHILKRNSQPLHGKTSSPWCAGISDMQSTPFNHHGHYPHHNVMLLPVSRFLRTWILVYSHIFYDTLSPSTGLECSCLSGVLVWAETFPQTLLAWKQRVKTTLSEISLYAAFVAWAQSRASLTTNIRLR